MAGVCFYFEDNDRDVYSGRRIDLDAWNYAIKAAGDVDQACVVNRAVADLSSPDPERIVFDEVGEDFDPANSIKLVTPWQAAPGSVSLWDFDHDVEWYLFGPAAGWTGESGLYIPQAGQAALHSIHIASVVLMHRYHVLNP